MLYSNFVKTLAGVGRLYLAGMTYGYPACCIEHFVQKVRIERAEDPWVDLDGQWYFGSGYIACPNCRQLDQAEILAGIEQRRFARDPFPVERSGMLDIHKAYRHFKKHGSPEGYGSLWELIESGFAPARRHLLNDRKHWRNDRKAKIQACSAVVGEFIRKHRKELAKANISFDDGWSFVSTRTCGKPEGMVLLLGHSRGRYIWAVSPGSKIEDKVSDSLVRGFRSSQGHYTPDTLVTAPVLVQQLYSAIWTGDGHYYDYGEVNDYLGQVLFRTQDLNYDFKVQLTGWYDKHGGPETLRQMVRKIFEREYVFFDEEFDLVGPDPAPFEINFYHEQYGWGDLMEFRQFSKDNDRLPLNLRIEYYFLMVQALKFEAYVNEVIEKQTKFLKGKESVFLDNIKTFVGQDMINHHVLTGNYVVVKFGERHVYIHSDAFQRKVWKQFLEACRDEGFLHRFGALPKLKEPLVGELGFFNQRMEINVEELVEKELGDSGRNIESMKDAFMRAGFEGMQPINPKVGQRATGEEYMAYYKRTREQTPTDYRLDEIIDVSKLDFTPLRLEDPHQATNENYALEADLHGFPIDDLNLLYPVQLERVTVTLQNTESVVPKHIDQLVGRLNRKGSGESKVYHIDGKLEDPTAGKAHEIDSEVFAQPSTKGFGDEIKVHVSEQGDKALIQKTNFELYQQAGVMGSEKPVVEDFDSRLVVNIDILRPDSPLRASFECEDVDVADAYPKQHGVIDESRDN